MSGELVESRALVVKEVIEKELVVHCMDFRLSLTPMSRFLMQLNRAYRSSSLSQYNHFIGDIRDMMISVSQSENLIRDIYYKRDEIRAWWYAVDKTTAGIELIKGWTIDDVYGNNSHQSYTEGLLRTVKEFLGVPLWGRFVRVAQRAYPNVYWFVESRDDFEKRKWRDGYYSGKRVVRRRGFVENKEELVFSIHYIRESLISYLIQKGFREQYPFYLAYLQQLSSMTSNPNAVEAEVYFSDWARKLLHEARSPDFLKDTPKSVLIREAV